MSFLDHLRFNGNREVLCALIEKKSYSGDRRCILTTGWDSNDWEVFLSELDFMYDSGYGGQVLYGTIWYVDGTWSERGEYDGSEWWEHRCCPVIPDILNRLDKVRDKKIDEVLNK